MNNEYIIVDKTAIQKEIEELKKQYDQKSKVNDNQWCSIISGQILALERILSQSTPLIPVIEQAVEFGKDIRREKSFINNNYGSPFVDYEDSTEETNNYISNLKLV